MTSSPQLTHLRKSNLKLTSNSAGTIASNQNCPDEMIIAHKIFSHPQQRGLYPNQAVLDLNGHKSVQNIRYPIAFIIATIITFIGTCIFFACLLMGLSITTQMFNRAFQIEYEISYFGVIQTIAIVISIVMGILSIMLLIFGCLSIGTTRSHIYSGFKSQLTSQIITAIFIGFVYLLFITWLAVSLLLVVPIVVYYLLMRNCDMKMSRANYISSHDCLYFNNMMLQTSDNRAPICANDLVAFCSQGKDAISLYIVALVASLLIVLGLVQYLCCLTANFASIRNGIWRSRRLRHTDEIAHSDYPPVTAVIVNNPTNGMRCEY